MVERYHMRSMNSRRVYQFIIGSLLLVSLIIPPSMAALNLIGSKYMDEIAPGQTVAFPMTLSVAATDSPADIEFSVLGFGNGPDGRYLGLDPSSDASRYTARPFVTLDKTSVHLDPGSKQVVTAAISVPSNAGAGGRYAIINIHTKPVGGGAVALVTAINVPVMITLKGTQNIETGEITGITVGEIVQGKPVTVTTNFVHTGNRHFYGAKNVIAVNDASGNIVAQDATKPSVTAIVPDGKVNYNTKITADLQPGSYTVTSSIIHGNGNVLATKSSAFTVSTAHSAPAGPVSITLTPDAPATLETPDGAISIQFPAGSVLGTTVVTLTPSPEGNIPSAPQGMHFATTTFSVDGLTGLLAQQATVKVRYTSDDLKAAGGDAGRLTLARWDKPPGIWTPLPTTVDQNAQTLTTSTNRLSLWAVLVTGGRAEGVEPEGAAGGSGGPVTSVSTVTILIVLGIIGALIAAVFILRKKQKT